MGREENDEHEDEDGDEHGGHDTDGHLGVLPPHLTVHLPGRLTERVALEMQKGLIHYTTI